MQRGAGPHPYRGRLRADSGFWLELSFCNEHGLPHSQFLHWHPEDRAKALAFLTEKGLRCVLCGTAEWEWDPEQGGRRDAYEPVEHRCHGCYLKAKAQSHDPTRDSDGITIDLLPTRTREAAQRHLKAARRRR